MTKTFNLTSSARQNCRIPAATEVPAGSEGWSSQTTSPPMMVISTLLSFICPGKTVVGGRGTIEPVRLCG
jgi:hypothetical protein